MVEYKVYKSFTQAMKGKYKELIQTYPSSSITPTFWLSIIDGNKNDLTTENPTDLREVNVLLGKSEAKQLIDLLKREIKMLKK